MSNAKKFRNAINAIQANGDDGTQNYIAAFLQYGVIINLVTFHIRPYKGALEDGLIPELIGFDSYEKALG